MIIAEIYNPTQWNNFFLLIGTGSAGLTGLVFVAMTINAKHITRDGTHVHRAMNMLTGFTATFIVSSLALMGGQTHRTLGLEWLAVALLATIVNTNGYIQAFRTHSSLYALSIFRMVGGTICYLAQIIGSLLLYSGSSTGLYISASGLVINMCFFVSGSWLLILGTHDSD